MPNSFQLQFKIQDYIDDIIENWCNEVHRITIESFRRKKDFLILFRIGNWDEKEYFFKRQSQSNLTTTRVTNNFFHYFHY